MGEEILNSGTDIISAENSTDINIINNNNSAQEIAQESEKVTQSQEAEKDKCSANEEKKELSNDELNGEIVSATQDTDKKEEQQFRIEPSNNQFKLRIVPIEKLLAKPPSSASSPPPLNHNSKKEAQTNSTTILRHLPERKNRKNYSIVEISDSEEEVSDTQTSSSSHKTKNDKQEKEVVSTTTTQQKQPLKRLQVQKNKNLNNLRKSEDDTSDSTTSSSCKFQTNTQKKENKSSPADKHPNHLQEKNSKDHSLKIQTALKEKIIKRCLVRIKRVELPNIAKNPTASVAKQKKPKMNGNKALGIMEIDNLATTSKFNLERLDKQCSDTDDDDAVLQMQEIANRATTIANNFSSEQNSEESDAHSSGSEIMPTRKKRVFNKRKTNSSANDSDFEPSNEKTKQPNTKRRRVKKNSSSGSDDKSNGEDDDENKNKRKHIRKIIKTKDLEVTTKTATKEEEDRRKRIEERQKLYNSIYEKPDSVEVDELVLDFDDESKEPLLEVDHGLLKRLKPHQVAGVKFMWDACFETLNESKEKPGSGCILAHCMGLGKTLQIVALTHTLLVNTRRTHVERVLIISPLSTLTNWAREFKHWMSFARKKNIEIYDLSRFKDKPTRIFKLNEWFEEGGVCILGYDMYRILTNEKAKGLRKKQRETLQKALVEPGPDLVVCDEGHLLKNEKTSISKAVTRMRTKRRIVLTGTPLQNNLKEYYCMIQFIKPNLLGTYKEYLNRFVNPITNGQYTDSTERDIRLMKHRSHILHTMLEGCIQRRDYSVLAPYLPPKHEYVVYTTLSDLQQMLYGYYMNIQRELSGSELSGKGARLFQDFQDLRRIWTHPMNLRVNSDNVIRKRILADESDSMEDFICDDEADDDEDDSKDSSSVHSVDSSRSFASGAGKRVYKPKKTRNNKNANCSDVEEIVPVQRNDPSEWWTRFVEEKELNNINHSPKLVILMRLLEQCEAIGDKLLVFSQSLQSLDVIEHFLKLIDKKTRGLDYEGDIGDLKGLWKPGQDYFRLDGSCSVEHREAMCKQFNNVTNLRGRLFLISTRAGGLGINLVAANRVVIFDVSWNPSHDTQSIFRVYRFGQEKPCYIYRLIAMGTMEQKVYERQVAKQATAKRVIDEQQISRHYNQSDLQELYTYELKPIAEREIPNLPKDRLFAELLTEHEKLLYKYHEHDSLLENEEGEHLSEDDRKAAWSEYEAEKTRTVQTAQYIGYDRTAFGSQFGNSAGSVTSNKVFGFRSDTLLQLLNMKVTQDHPEYNQNQVIQLVPSYLQRLYAEMNNGDPTIYKDLLALHTTLSHPSGMYMSPLLYANQDPGAAGYYQAGVGQQVPGVSQPPPQQLSTPRFDPNEVYEID